MKEKIIIFTDLDGTLLDAKTYSFEAAKGALIAIKEKNIPLVLISSKTAKEILHYRKRINNYNPFVSENGGGVFIPKGYFNDFPFWIERTEKYGYDMISLGTPYEKLRRAVRKLREQGFNVRGFADVGIEELMDITGLPEEEARSSKERNFDEPLILEGAVDMEALKKAIRDLGFKYTSGNYLHIIGNNSKGNAVRELRDLYKRNYGDITTIAVGDNVNDISMFLNVDIPVVVQKPNGTHDPVILKEVPNIRVSPGIGPEGFNTCVQTILGEISD